MLNDNVMSQHNVKGDCFLLFPDMVRHHYVDELEKS